MDLNAGGHLSHGASVQLQRQVVQRRSTTACAAGRAHRLRRGRRARARAPAEADHCRRLGLSARHRLPGLPRAADAAGAHLLVDMAHFAGLVAGGAHPSPFPHADIARPPPTSRCAARAAASSFRTTRTCQADQQRRLPGSAGYARCCISLAGKAVASARRCGPSSAPMPPPCWPTPARSPSRAAAPRLRPRRRRHRHAADAGRSARKGSTAPAAKPRARRHHRQHESDSLRRRRPEGQSGLRFGVSAATTRGFGVAIRHGWRLDCRSARRARQALRHRGARNRDPPPGRGDDGALPDLRRLSPAYPGITVTVRITPPVAGWARSSASAHAFLLEPLGFTLQGLDEGVALQGPSDAPGAAQWQDSPGRRPSPLSCQPRSSRGWCTPTADPAGAKDFCAYPNLSALHNFLAAVCWQRHTTTGYKSRPAAFTLVGTASTAPSKSASPDWRCRPWRPVGDPRIGRLGGGRQR